jgi:hypothetical protein
MSKIAILFLKFILWITALGAAAFFCVALPKIIGDINFQGYDPILLGMYLTAPPFFIALYHGMKLLSFIDTGTAFSDDAIQSVKIIQTCAVIVSAMYALGMPYIFYIANLDDAPGVVLIGLIFTAVPIIIAAGAEVFKVLLKKGA